MTHMDNARSPHFSIALVNYRTLDLTKRCLDLLKAHIDNGLPATVWVVDNDSRDESINYLRSLEWINLIERPAPRVPEKGYMAHARGLDLVLGDIKTEYVFVMHTDTFVHDPSIFDRMLERMSSDHELFAIGCLEQTHRGPFRTAWRNLSRAIKMRFRTLKQRLGLATRPPKSVAEKNIKSFFACWNARIIRESGMFFAMADRNPGYELQDRLVERGFRIEIIESGELFKYLDHVQAGTKSLIPCQPESRRHAARTRRQGKLSIKPGLIS